MNWEQAKQRIAENAGYSTFSKYVVESRFTVVECCKQAAELWQQSNLERIKELTADKKEYEGMLDESYMKSKNQLLRIKELEDGFSQILNSPTPYNDRELQSWYETAREIVNKQLLK